MVMLFSSVLQCKRRSCRELWNLISRGKNSDAVCCLGEGKVYNNGIYIGKRFAPRENEAVDDLPHLKIA